MVCQLPLKIVVHGSFVAYLMPMPVLAFLGVYSGVSCMRSTTELPQVLG